jgi:hypothetical protein
MGKIWFMIFRKLIEKIWANFDFEKYFLKLQLLENCEKYLSTIKEIIAKKF